MSEVDSEQAAGRNWAGEDAADVTTYDALGAAPGKPLSPAARRALEEAQARRARSTASLAPGEEGGPAGLEPTRFGDWERKGLAVDF